MAAVAHLDTHVVAWLWAGDRRRLKPIQRRLERAELRVSPVVLLELQFLFELGRITESPQVIIEDLVPRVGLKMASAPLSLVVEHARSLSWTRDPIDRLIVGHALAEQATLLTADERIHANCRSAWWD